VVLQHLKSPKQPTWERVLPKGISIPSYALRQRFITRSAFPASPDATASMRDDFGRVLPQTCAGLYDIKEAGFTSLLTPSEGRFSTPKGDIRIQTRPLTRLAEKPGNTMGRAIKIGLRNFLRSRCSSQPLTRLAFVGKDHILTLPTRKYRVCMEVSGKGASGPSRPAARVRGRDCQLVFPGPIPIGYPAHMERNSSGVWFGHSNGIWFGDTFCSGPHRH
jgi:hypothetical protein